MSCDTTLGLNLYPNLTFSMLNSWRYAPPNVQKNGVNLIPLFFLRKCPFDKSPRIQFIIAVDLPAQHFSAQKLEHPCYVLRIHKPVEDHLSALPVQVFPAK